MARISAQQAETFPDNAGGRFSFLGLQNDKDRALVRFAYKSINDIPTYSVHDVYVDGKYKHIGCLRTDGSQPESLCPLCASGNTAKRVVYFNLRNEETGEMQLWSRSYRYFHDTMLPYLQGYEGELHNIPYIIQRSGERGSTSTTYAFIAQPAKPMPLEEFPEEIDVEEVNIIKNYSFDELQNYVNTGNLPSGNVNNVAPQASMVNPGIQPRRNNFGQPARVEDYAQPMQPQQGYGIPNQPQQYPQAYGQAPVNTNRRTVNNNGGY